MKSITSWLFDTKHPIRVALVCLVLGLANLYEAVYVDSPGGLMQIVSWVFVVTGFFGCVLFILQAL